MFSKSPSHLSRLSQLKRLTRSNSNMRLRKPFISGDERPSASVFAYITTCGLSSEGAYCLPAQGKHRQAQDGDHFSHPSVKDYNWTAAGQGC